jgi:hypothetical protein
MRRALRIRVFGALVLVAASGCPAVSIADPSDAGPNPFARPAVTAGEIAPTGAGGKPTFVLRATMASPRGALVNVDGHILSVGEELVGYRLVSVGEGTAVFVRNGVPYVVTVGEEQ